MDAGHFRYIYRGVLLEFVDQGEETPQQAHATLKDREDVGPFLSHVKSLAVIPDCDLDVAVVCDDATRAFLLSEALSLD